MHAGDLEKAERGDMFWGSGGSRVATAVARTMLFAAGVGSFEGFEPDVLLGDGQDLGDSGLDATVLSLPGHTAGSIGVLTGDGDLLCGDLLVNTRRPAQNSLAEDASRIAAGVAMLEARGIRTVYPGHGEPFAWERLHLRGA
jgi:glyoxylase-like metal-dependent hydrolase (beta-lactamase superfamily II)